MNIPRKNLLVIAGLAVLAILAWTAVLLIGWRGYTLTQYETPQASPSATFSSTQEELLTLQEAWAQTPVQARDTLCLAWTTDRPGFWAAVDYAGITDHVSDTQLVLFFSTSACTTDAY